MSSARAVLRAFLDGDTVPYPTFVTAIQQVPGETTVPIRKVPGGVKLHTTPYHGGEIDKIERWIDPMNQKKYGDIRDQLVLLPQGDIHGQASYAIAYDLFVVRHQIISEFGPRCGSVFEFGALYGYFLVTALDACRYIHSVGWCDNEQHTAGSNLMVLHNLADAVLGLDDSDMGRDGEVSWPRVYTHRDQVIFDIDRIGLQYDLVSVDAGHSYDECLADLHAAHKLQPKWIMVDDWTAATHRDEVQPATRDFLEQVGGGYSVSEHVTENGLAMLTRAT